MKPGIYTSSQLSNEQYHSIEGISKSGLDLIARSPAHFANRESKESTRAMEIGSAIHCAILENEKYGNEYITVDCLARTSAIYKSACKDRDPAKVLTQGEGDKIAGMFNSVMRNHTAADLLFMNPGDNELSVFAEDPETGVLVKCRFDRLLLGGIAVDLKKTQDARPDPFSRAIENYRYHVQAAFYMDVYKWATGDELHAFKFVAVEESAPHGVRVYTLDDESIMVGRALYRDALNTYAYCKNAGTWPCYPQEDEVIGIPSWAISRFEDDLEVVFEGE
jgi:exodeoxyribonuclease VIII